MAFSFQSSNPPTNDRVDSDYVRWYTTFVESKNGAYSEFSQPLKPCTASDLEKFFPPIDSQTRKKVKKLVDDDLLFCFDSNNYKFELYGSWYSGLDYTALDIGLYSCASHLEGSNDTPQESFKTCV